MIISYQDVLEKHHREVTFEKDLDSYVEFFSTERRGRTFQVVEMEQGKGRR